MNGHRIRSHPILAVSPRESIQFTWKGQSRQAQEGETIASALFANGIRVFGYHPKDGSPQGIFCANGQCAQCTVIADSLPVKACMTLVKPGMVLEPLTAPPRIPNTPPVRDFKTIETVQTDCLIIGGGPAGLSAAIELGSRRIRVLIVDIIRAAVQAGVSIIPRGAGTGLVGGAIGEGLVIDFSRYNRMIWDFDPGRRTVRVGAGVVLDHLNNHLRHEGLAFGSDVATSARATLGGMIANNSSGAHTPLYGTTADHLVELEIVLGDGRVVQVGPGHDLLKRQRELLEDMAMFNALQIAERFAPGLVKRWPGYALDRVLREPGNLVRAGSASGGASRPAGFEPGLRGLPDRDLGRRPGPSTPKDPATWGEAFEDDTDSG